VAIYQSISRMLRKEVRTQLLISASILAKSSELEPHGVVYEWREAMETGTEPEVAGLFQFWDVKSGATAASPALGQSVLEPFHGPLNVPVLRTIVLPDGRPAMAVGLLHQPFLDSETADEMKRLGRTLRPEDLPQVLVCARETRSIDEKLERMKGHLVRAGIATLLAIWLSMFGIMMWSLKPIDRLTRLLDKRSRDAGADLPATPPEMPGELAGLADAFNRTLERAEAASQRERRFALHAAHELRTPIAGIRSTLEQALSRPRGGDDLTRRISLALEITKGMNGTIGSLMRLARLRGEMESVDWETFDPAPLIWEAIGREEARFAERGLKPDPVGPRTTDAIESDRGLLDLLVSILVDNVVRHAPPGTVVNATLEWGPADLKFTLRNRTKEISAENLETLFEPFQRGGFDDGGGAGLGLSLAREVAALIGADLSAALDEGCFMMRLRLPRRRHPH
jgi:signal transduction histidine kinase